MANGLIDVGAPLLELVRSYLEAVMASFSEQMATPEAGTGDPSTGVLFSLLTARQFSHLGRGRTERYRAAVTSSFERDLSRGEPLEFSYDIGPGYHATLVPGESALRFDVALSELLLLHQIKLFCDSVAEIYPPGARFWLVIDNLCGHWTNGISIERTEAYAESLRQLIRALRLEHRVDLIVESEQFDQAEYGRRFDEIPPEFPALPPQPNDIENVARFLGRRCGRSEALDRIDRYRRATTVTEHLLEPVVRGVRMTQRATDTTLGFRAFAGGDARTQCGEVVITPSSKGSLRPALLTSGNVGNYDCIDFGSRGLLPLPISSVTYAEPRG